MVASSLKTTEIIADGVADGENWTRNAESHCYTHGAFVKHKSIVTLAEFERVIEGLSKLP